MADVVAVVEVRDAAATVAVQTYSAAIVSVSQPVAPRVIERGISGPQGAQGPVGPTGAPGVALQYVHTQSLASDTWAVNHNLGSRPQVSVLSVGGKELMAEVIHSSENQTFVYFDQPTAGTAICT